MKNIALLLLLTLLSLGELSATDPQRTFYSYKKSDLNALTNLQSKETLSAQELKKWDLFAQNVIDKLGLGYDHRTLFFTYLYAAQRDAVFLSYEANECFVGSFDPISAKIFLLFFPNEPLPKNLKKDAYSEKLALIIGQKYAARYESERNLPATQWQLWGIVSQELKIDPPPPPSSPIWKKELQSVIDAQDKISAKEKEAIHFWSHKGEDSSLGDWRIITNDYLFELLEPLPKMTLVRSLVTMAIIDSIIVTKQAKKAYENKRPYQESDQVRLLTNPQDTSSYPSTHATIATAVADILSTFFPEDTKRWEEFAVTGSLSRIWAGVHYPIDKRAGEKIGCQIGEQLLESLNN